MVSLDLEVFVPCEYTDYGTVNSNMNFYITEQY